MLVLDVTWSSSKILEIETLNYGVKTEVVYGHAWLV